MKIHNKFSVVDITKVPIEIQKMILKRLHTHFDSKYIVKK